MANLWNRLAWTLKAHEQRGGDATELLAAAGAPATLPDLLHYVESAARTGRPEADDVLPPWLHRYVPPSEPEYQTYLVAAREQIAARVDALALDAGTIRPAWSVVFGDPPIRQQWTRHLGTVAAYRDQYEVSDDTAGQPLGPHVEPGRAAKPRTGTPLAPSSPVTTWRSTAHRTRRWIRSRRRSRSTCTPASRRTNVRRSPR